MIVPGIGDIELFRPLGSVGLHGVSGQARQHRKTTHLSLAELFFLSAASCKSIRNYNGIVCEPVHKWLGEAGF